MRPSYLIVSLVLLPLAIDAIAVLPSAAATPTAVATPAVVGASKGAGGGGAGASRSDLLCAGLLASGLLGNVLTVAPLPVARKSDPAEKIQFTRIWSDSQQATVGGQASEPVPVPHATSAAAVVKLPIAFSAVDRQKFEESGWKRREPAGGHAVTYCLESGGRPDDPGTSMAHGMICVSAGP